MLFQSLFLSTLVLAQQPLSGTSLIVRTGSGEVVGSLSNTTKVRSWIGIPYAKSPPERFSPPEAAKPWTTPLQAVREKPSCIQQFTYPEASRNLTIKIFSNPLPLESEDCLYINVWAPSKPAPPEGWPVMFWIYGGNLQFGHGMLPMYRGENMAKNGDVVVVTFNYRINVFGFPGSPTINAKAHNLGFLDQRFALDWVQKNINNFSGDPSRLVMFGESAGGFSVKQILANPPKSFLDKAGDKAPFAGAILESQASGVRDARDAWKKLVVELKCKNETSTTATEFACVKAESASTIKVVIEKGRYSFGPIEDGATFAKDVRPLLKAASPAVKKVPVILGSNSDEGSPFVEIAMAGRPNGTLNNVFEGFLGGAETGGNALAEALLVAATPLYPKDKYSNEKTLGNGIFTDIAFQCPANTLSRSMVDDGWTSVRRYYYIARFPDSYPYPNAGAYHGSEIEPVFGTYKIFSQAGGRPTAERLSKVLMTLWTGLAWGPKSKEIAAWPVLTATERPVKVFDVDADRMTKAEELDVRCNIMGPMAEVQGT